MALRALMSLALLALWCWCSSSGELLEMGSNITRINSGFITFPLINIHGDASPFRHFNSTRSNRIAEYLKSDIHRQKALFKKKNRQSQVEAEGDVPLASGGARGNINYIIKLNFGTPGQSLYTMVDTGSDISWIPCNSCKVFQARKSSTFKHLPCSSTQCGEVWGNCRRKKCAFRLLYMGGVKVEAVLSSDELTTGRKGKASNNVHISRFIFGCSNAQSNLEQDALGLIGFGRRNLSFISQTATMYGRVFSYCLPSFNSPAFSGSLSLGKTSLTSIRGLRFTPLLPNPPGFPSYYYVGLVGVSVGKERFFMPRESLWPTATGAGTIIDSGALVTQLVDPLYIRFRDSFHRQTNLSEAPSALHFDNCYTIPSGRNVFVPQITLHFLQRLNLHLPEESVLFPTDDKGSNVCLAFASAGVGPSALSMIGNYQQQKLRVVYDVPGSRLGIVPENCHR